MHITPYSADVRIVSGRGDYELVVEKRVDGQWERDCSFNEMSNDWAYSEASNAARQLARDIWLQSAKESA